MGDIRLVEAVVWTAREASNLRRLREEVFIEEQRVPVEEEFDDIDPVAHHVLVYDGEKAVGTGRLYDQEDGTVGRIGRMAVAKSCRGKGVGRLILRALMSEGVRRGYQLMILDAQVQAIPFYMDSGFVVTGEEHLDCGIPHRMMEISASEASGILDQ